MQRFILDFNFHVSNTLFTYLKIRFVIMKIHEYDQYFYIIATRRKFQHKWYKLYGITQNLNFKNFSRKWPSINLSR